jgi:hypothetical protein
MQVRTKHRDGAVSIPSDADAAGGQSGFVMLNVTHGDHLHEKEPEDSLILDWIMLV